MCPIDPVRNEILCVLVVDTEVDTFWHCDVADEEQRDNGCVAHLTDSCWIKETGH